jgi:hypothetical protein
LGTIRGVRSEGLRSSGPALPQAQGSSNQEHEVQRGKFDREISSATISDEREIKRERKESIEDISLNKIEED